MIMLAMSSSKGATAGGEKRPTGLKHKPRGETFGNDFQGASACRTSPDYARSFNSDWYARA